MPIYHIRFCLILIISMMSFPFSLICKDSFEDRLVYKVETKILFVADINELIKKTNLFKCTLGDSFALAKYKISDMGELKVTHDLSLKKKKLKNILKLLKTIEYIRKENLPLSTKARNLFIESAKTGSCGKVDFDDFQNGLLSQLLKVEIYMKNRFHISKFNVSSVEFRKERKKISEYSDKKAMELIKKRKQKKAIKDFLKTLNSQINHHEYF